MRSSDLHRIAPLLLHCFRLASMFVLVQQNTIQYNIGQRKDYPKSSDRTSMGDY